MFYMEIDTRAHDITDLVFASETTPLDHVMRARLSRISFSSRSCSLNASDKGLFPPQQKSIEYSVNISAAFGNQATMTPIISELNVLSIYFQ